MGMSLNHLQVSVDTLIVVPAEQDCPSDLCRVTDIIEWDENGTVVEGFLLYGGYRCSITLPANKKFEVFA